MFLLMVWCLWYTCCVTDFTVVSNNGDERSDANSNNNHSCPQWCVGHRNRIDHKSY